MHYLDPERPRLHADGGLPLLQGVANRTVLPGLHISPRGTPDATQMEISIFLPSGHGGASRRHITLDLWEFPAFWLEWLSDPERTARERFNWTAAAPTKTLKVMSIEDLLGD